MRINGKNLDGPVPLVVVIPRANGNVVFKAKAVQDYSDFDALCPKPEAPQIMRPGGATSVDVTDKDYLAAMGEYSTKKVDWIILESLSATDDLEWETVVKSEPDTWGNYEKELTVAGFLDSEQQKIVGIVVDINGLNESLIEEATKGFLASQQEAREKESSQVSEQNGTQSGAPANE